MAPISKGCLLCCLFRSVPFHFVSIQSHPPNEEFDYLSFVPFLPWFIVSQLHLRTRRIVLCVVMHMSSASPHPSPSLNPLLYHAYPKITWPFCESLCPLRPCFVFFAGTSAESPQHSSFLMSPDSEFEKPLPEFFC